MLFNSIHFLLFFPVVVVLYFLLPHKYRWIFLLVASYYFYMCWKAEYIFLIIASTTVDYFAGIKMEEAKSTRRKRLFLMLSLLSNLGLLFTFKYFNFLSDSVHLAFQSINIFYDAPTFKLLLPVGISFYTFQTLSYSIDIFKGKRKAERHLGYFALYVSFFPQLVAGPIERSTRLLPQFFVKQEFSMSNLGDGLKLMMWGFFKKVVIADRLAILVNQVYNHSEMHNGVTLLIATYFFAFQIFCDFSGYSDIAIGAAKVMGFDLMKNFDRPYYSKNISEFWKRWHISLSTWFRDYLYIPLGGNRVNKWRWYFNLFVTFLVSGLWHGANWTFVVWGAIHGFYLVFAIWTKSIAKWIYKALGLNSKKRIRDIVDVFITFHLVLFAWVFFRANSLQDAIYILSHLFPLQIGEFLDMLQSTGATEVALGLTKKSLILAVLSIGLMEMVHFYQRKKKMKDLLAKQPTLVRWTVYYAFIIIIISFGEFSMQEFIYFQF